MDEVKDIVGRVLNKLLKQAPQPGKHIEDIWHTSVNSQIQQHTTIAGVHKQQLIIHVDSSAWLYQMNLIKNNILKDIQKKMPEIQGIQFKAGKE